MTRPVILLDADGVLCDLVTPLVDEANLRLQKLWEQGLIQTVHRPEEVTPDDVKDYDIAKAFPDLTPKHVYAPLYRQGFCRSLKPYPGAVEAVRRLQELGEVYCVTKPTPSPYWMAEREEWCGVVMGIPADHVIFCHDKGMIRGDVMVDDNPEFLRDWWIKCSGNWPFLWDRPYNRRSEIAAVRVSSWEPVIERVEKLT